MHRTIFCTAFPVKKIIINYSFFWYKKFLSFNQSLEEFNRIVIIIQLLSETGP